MKRLAPGTLVALAGLMVAGCSDDEPHLQTPTPAKPPAQGGPVLNKCPTGAAVSRVTRMAFEDPVHAAEGMDPEFRGMDCSYRRGSKGSAVIYFYWRGTDANAVRADLGADTPVDIPGASKAHNSDDGTVVFEVEDRVVSTAYKGDTAAAIAMAKIVLGTT